MEQIELGRIMKQRIREVSVSAKNAAAILDKEARTRENGNSAIIFSFSVALQFPRIKRIMLADPREALRASASSEKDARRRNSFAFTGT